MIDYKHLVQDDRIHASLYTDPRVFDDEMERVFHRGWVFVGHASEIPRPGDYVTRTVGTEPVIMVRAGDNRARIETRVKLLQTGVRHSQEPASLMRRLISNIEVEAAGDGDLIAGSNFILAELAVQARRELHWWAGRATHRLRRVAGEFRMSRKTVVLVNAAEPLPNLAFLI
jgi:3-phenylpropionate/cinnamic acid dioxygenase small subunit